MHRFGDKVDPGTGARSALEDLERGNLPESADMAALLLQLVVERDPQTVQVLSAILDRRKEEVFAQAQDLEEENNSRVEQEGRSGEKPA